MSGKKLLEEALEFNVEKRALIVDCLLKNLDEPDSRIDQIWFEEAKKKPR